MGSSCGILKPKEEEGQVVIPIKAKRFLRSAPPPDEQEAKFGKYFAESSSSKPFLKQWQKLLFTQESAILKHDKKFIKEFHSYTFRGIPNEFRWRVWTNQLMHEKHYSEDSYFHIPPAGEPHLSTIKRDLDRSFPSEAYFDLAQFGLTGQQALERILSKFAFKYPEVGYCQGMNFLAGFLLLVSGGAEIEVFQFFEVLFKTFQLDGFFKEGMEGLKEHIWIAKRLIKKIHPKISEHFERECIPDDLWLFKWIMTVFTMILPSNVLVRVWDLFLFKGFRVVYKVVLAILAISQEDLLARDSGEICTYLAGIRERITSSEELFKQLRIIKLSKDQMEKFGKQHQVISKNQFIPVLKAEEQDVKLPPLRINRNKVKVLQPLSKTPVLKRALSGIIKNNLIGMNSPLTARPSKVPHLPDINLRRTLVKKKSFGVTNKSWEISLKKSL
jgi:hypothetical protein